MPQIMQDFHAQYVYRGLFLRRQCQVVEFYKVSFYQDELFSLHVV